MFVVVVIFVTDPSPSFSHTTVTTPHIQGDAQKYPAAIQLNTIAQLHYLIQIVAIPITGCSNDSDLLLNLSYTTTSFLAVQGPQSRNQNFSSQ